MKSERHNKILEIISEKNIDTQEELVNALLEEGYNVTQATVSRDIRELKLTKVSEGGVQKYVVHRTQEKELDEKYLRVLKDGYVSMDMAQNILVIKTASGTAMALATALDSLHWDEIVGTIAGDDTVMCAIRTVEDTRKLMKRLEEILK